MAFRLVVADTVIVPLNFKLADAGKTKNFAFTLDCDRVTNTEWDERIRDEKGNVKDSRIKALMLDITTGWNNQTLVLGDDGEPAPFCKEALEVMFEASGVLDMAVASYMKEKAAKGKN